MSLKVAIVIPTYKAKKSILQVIQQAGAPILLGDSRLTAQIIVVDDACPEESGKWVQSQLKLVNPSVDSKNIHVVFHERNLGVGAATMTGYRVARDLHCDIAVKVDADLQMDLDLLPQFLEKIEAGFGYVKGNRFYAPKFLKKMPMVRLIGNSGLSFVSKISTGYYGLMDPTNGYTALNLKLLDRLELDQISQRFFFETDVLFHLYLARVPVAEVPTPARYGDEVSNLSISHSLFYFLQKNCSRTLRRIFYTYFLRDFNPGSLFLVCGVFISALGACFGAYKWWQGIQSGIPATAGTGIIAAVILLIGINLLIQFIQFDIQNQPRRE